MLLIVGQDLPPRGRFACAFTCRQIQNLAGLEELLHNSRMSVQAHGCHGVFTPSSFELLAHYFVSSNSLRLFWFGGDLTHFKNDITKAGEKSGLR
jgi:hypothetical protein